jgi:hypothetical protein
MEAYKLETFIYKHETCPIASKFKSVINVILNYCITNFIENIYVVDFNKKDIVAQESTYFAGRG